MISLWIIGSDTYCYESIKPAEEDEEKGQKEEKQGG